MRRTQIFLLSPAHCGGKRAGYLLREGASFELAVKLREQGATLAEIFSFCSGLYFRGKVAYASRFARPPAGLHGSYVITTNRGLLPAETIISHAELSAMNCGGIDANRLDYAQPLLRASNEMAQRAPDCSFILLGSIATGKYVDLLIRYFGEKLLFPTEFIGRGDMSRGGLMLRSAREETELVCAPVLNAVRRGKRPAKLQPATRGSAIDPTMK